jgi:hypothetical protein
MVSKNEDIGTECSVCMVNNKTHVLVPCGHLCVCQECAGKFTCPLPKLFRKTRRKIMKTKYRENHGKNKRMPSLSNFCFAGLSLSVWTY